MQTFDTVSRIGDSLLFHMADDENAPCTTLDAKQAEAFALAILSGVHDIESTSFDESDWPGIRFNTSRAET